jgi:hypothetical protein
VWPESCSKSWVSAAFAPTQMSIHNTEKPRRSFFISKDEKIKKEKSDFRVRFLPQKSKDFSIK